MENEENAQPMPSLARWLHLKPPKPPSDEETSTQIPGAFDHLLSQLWFHWCTPLLVLGWKRNLTENDILQLPREMAPDVLSDRLDLEWRKQLAQVKRYNQMLPDRARSGWWKFRRKSPKKPSLTKAAVKVALSSLFLSALYKLVADVSIIFAPYALGKLLHLIDIAHTAANAGQQEPPFQHDFAWVVALFALQFFSAIFWAQYSYKAGVIGSLVKSALVRSLYKRMMNARMAQIKLTPSKLFTHVSSDVGRIEASCSTIISVVSAPLQVAICMWLLYYNLGWSAFAGVAVILIVFPLENIIAVKLLQARSKCAALTDERIQLVRELIQDISDVKALGYQGACIARIASISQAELRHVKRILVTRAATQSLALIMPNICAVVGIAVYASQTTRLDPSALFASLALFHVLRYPLISLPDSIHTAVDAWHSFHRLTYLFEEDDTNFSTPVPIDDASPFAIELIKATFCWAADASDPQAAPLLRGMNLTVRRGEMLAITGALASGKTSLLHCILGEMTRISGTVAVNGKIAYVPQRPWCSSASFRENILFGLPFEQKFYAECLASVCLLTEVDELENGDETLIGDGTYVLSTNQLARVCLARALYQQADIYLVDDCFASLSLDLSLQILANLRDGLWKNKTVLLTTHTIQLTAKCDRVFSLSLGALSESQNSATSQYLPSPMYTPLLKEGAEEAYLLQPLPKLPNLRSSLQGKLWENIHRSPSSVVSVRPSILKMRQVYKTSLAEFGSSMKMLDNNSNDEHIVDQLGLQNVVKADTVDSKLPSKEVAFPRVPFRVYFQYFRFAGNLWHQTAILILLVLLQFVLLLTQYWLVVWQRQQITHPQLFRLEHYAGVYAVIVALNAGLLLLIGSLIATMSVLASSRLQRDALSAIVASPMSFYNEFGAQAIIARLTRDVDVTNNLLSDSWRSITLIASGTLSGFIIIIVALPYYALAVVLVLAIWFVGNTFHLKPHRELRLIDRLFRTSQLKQYAETLSGSYIIRSFGQQEAAIRDNETWNAKKTRSGILLIASQRWLMIRVDTLCSLLTLLVASVSIIERFKLSPALSGVALASLLSLQQGFTGLTRQCSTIEGFMTSVQRLLEYCFQVTCENDDSAGSLMRISSGHVSFANVCMAYTARSRHALRNVSFSLASGEKVAILGSHRSGKTTILDCILRFYPLTSGSISLGGTNVSDLDIKILRSSVAYIPHSIAVFKGTVRWNLDPDAKFDDAHLNLVLQKALLSSTFSLDTIIDDTDSMISPGQKHLISLARALLKAPKLLLLENFAGLLDQDTIEAVDNVIKNEFSEATVMQVADQPASILHFDKVLWMDAGSVAEFGSPLELYQKAGPFRRMCDAYSIQESDFALQN